MNFTAERRGDAEDFGASRLSFTTPPPRLSASTVKKQSSVPLHLRASAVKKHTMVTTLSGIEELVWERLSLIPDPEIPVISILELGIVRDVHYDGEMLEIIITPTYTGCPAMNLFVAEIKAAMHDQGFDNLKVTTVYSPAWTTDLIPADAMERLKKYGIAPPVKGSDDPFAQPPAIPCPHCGSEHTSLVSQFGATACKSLYTCNDCKEPFEYFKHF